MNEFERALIRELANNAKLLERIDRKLDLALKIGIADLKVDAEDLKLLLVTDDLDTVAAHIERYSVQHFGLRPEPRPSRWLGERTVNAAAKH